MTDTFISTTERWEDLRFPATSINPVGQVSPPTLNNTNGTLEFSAAGVEIIAFQAQLPHSWKQWSGIRPHVHWRKKTEGTGNVVWRLTYEFQNVGGTFTDSVTTDSVSSAHPDTPDTGTALVHLITPFAEIPMTDKRVSCMGMLTLARVGDDGADNYAGVAQFLEFDIHYQVDSLGSGSEYTKHGTYGPGV
jgi:hypothetical protein